MLKYIKRKSDMKAYDVISICNELMESKLLFADQKIDKLLEAIASCPEVYELLSDCMNNFNKEKEFEKAFTKDASGAKLFVLPKEEYKILALAFCILADVGNKKISFDELVMTYFNDDGKLDGKKFMTNVILPFRDLIAEAFSVAPEKHEEVEAPEIPEEEMTPEQKLKVVPFPIERASNYLRDKSGMCQTFVMAKDVAVEMVERLEDERLDAQKRDCISICHAIIIACMEQDFDLVFGLVRGLKYAAKGVKSIRHNLRELDDILQRQLDHESKF